MIWVCSDVHCDPDYVPPNFLKWIEEGKKQKAILIVAGDLLNILPWGRDKWSRQSPSIRQINEALEYFILFAVPGNHDPEKELKRVVFPSHIHVTSSANLVRYFNLNYYITHGHQWALDWGILGLNRVAPSFVEFMVKYFPSQWYRYCKARGWLASKQKPSGIEHEPITKLTRIVWKGAVDHAVKKKVCVIHGHTHCNEWSTYATKKDATQTTYHIDCGDINDGTFCEITDDARRKWIGD